MADRREKSFFAPLLLSGGLLVLLGIAVCMVPVMDCAKCWGMGYRPYDKWEHPCSGCKGRGRVPVVDRQAWQLR